MQSDYVQYEVQGLLLRIREYKRQNGITITKEFAEAFEKQTLQAILNYEDSDEQVQIALVNFYSKVCSQVKNDQIIAVVNKITNDQDLYLQKKLKFIRSAFTATTPELLPQLIAMNKSVENTQKLLIKEMARDQLAQSLMHLLKQTDIYDDYLFDYSLKEINELIKQKTGDSIRLIEQPFNIAFTIVQKQNKILDFIYILVQLTNIEHPVINNYILQGCNYIFSIQFDDLFETRILLGQVVLKLTQQQINKLKGMSEQEQSSIDRDTHILIRFLQNLFADKDQISIMYKKTDYNPFLGRVFEPLIAAIFGMSSAILSQSLKVQLYDLQVLLFKNGLSKGSKSKNDLDQWINEFNAHEDNPRKVITQLKEEVAVRMLRLCTRLNQQYMVAVLGYHKDYCVKIMERYISCFKFHGLGVVEAMRVLASNFLLFGESQMIERVLNQFTIQYYAQNTETVFKHVDNLYTYTYAIILLNTDLYNKTLTDHMSFESYMRNVAKINSGENLPEELLRKDYDSIAEREIKCCRDLAFDQIPPIIWNRYVNDKEELKQEYQQLMLDFNIKQDPEAYGDIILTQMVKNIEYMVQHTSNTTELTSFISQILQLCTSQDKFSQAQEIFAQMLKQKLYYICYFIAEQLLAYTVDFNLMAQLIRETIVLRHQMATDSISLACRELLLKVHNNNKFSKKQMGSNKGLFSMLQQFLQQDEDVHDDALLPITPDLNPREGIRSENLLKNIVEQTRFLDTERLIEFVQALLKFEKEEYLGLIHNLYIVVEILRVNNDRINALFPEIANVILNPPPIQKNVKSLVEEYLGFMALKCSIEFNIELPISEQCYEKGLSYLKNASLEIIHEFLQELSISPQSQRVFKIIQIMLSILEQKTLDVADAQLIMAKINEIKFPIDPIQLIEMMNQFLKQQQLEKDELFLRLLSDLIECQQQQKEIISLICSIGDKNIGKILQLLQRVTLNYNYDSEDAIMLFKKMSQKSQLVIQTNNEQLIITYTQMLQKSYFNTVKNFNEQQFQEVIVKFQEILTSIGSESIKENVLQSFQSGLLHLGQIIQHPSIEAAIKKF